MKWIVLIVTCDRYYQFSSVTQSCRTLRDPMNRSTPGLPVHHQLQEFTQTHVHRVSDAIQPSHPLSSPFPPAPNPSVHDFNPHWPVHSHSHLSLTELLNLEAAVYFPEILTLTDSDSFSITSNTLNKLGGL